MMTLQLMTLAAVLWRSAPQSILGTGRNCDPNVKSSCGTGWQYQCNPRTRVCEAQSAREVCDPSQSAATCPVGKLCISGVCETSVCSTCDWIHKCNTRTNHCDVSIAVVGGLVVGGLWVLFILAAIILAARAFYKKRTSEHEKPHPS